LGNDLTHTRSEVDAGFDLTGHRGSRNSLRHNLRRHLAEFKPHCCHHNDDFIASPSEFARFLHREGISMIRA
jgi:hypothetical protein